MPIHIEDYRVKQGQKIDLKKWPTVVKPYYHSDNDSEDILAKHIDQLRHLQNILYAHNKYALLLIFQAIDAAGKDSAIKHVMSGVNPQGCQVFSFKHPSTEELEHDFLWRTTRCLPERGRIGIFNRSYYEEVLVVRVHPEILKAQNIPDDVFTEKSIWQQRYRSIVDLEGHLYSNGTRILKFFLHVSKEEQRKRFLKRIDDPSKNWKFSAADMKERSFWKKYMKAYEQCLESTSTKGAPWHIVPADDKQNAQLIISQTIIEALGGMHLEYPKMSLEQRKGLEALRAQLAKS